MEVPLPKDLPHPILDRGAEVELCHVESDFMIVGKPAPLLSHPTRPDGAVTLLGCLQARFPGEFLALINRLDRETSGAILVARSPEAASQLGKMTQFRQIHKQYLALVYGRWPLEEPHGFIEGAIGRLGVSEQNPIWVRQGILPLDDSEGRKVAQARSEFWFVRHFGDFSLIRLQAHTGRLHQLRVHLASKGYPVVGDKIYGPDPMLYLRFIEEGWTPDHERRLLLPRHALHAVRMEFEWQGRSVQVEVPLPGELLTFIEQKS